jgi:hypothetical protein
MQHQQKEPLRRRRPRGVLAFLGQQEHVTQYPYDSDAWKTPKPIPTRSRSTRRSRRNRSSSSRQQPQPQPSTTSRINDDNGNNSIPNHDHLVDHSIDEADVPVPVTAVSTESRRLLDICEEYPVILLFLFDPHQPHSYQIRNQLVRLCAAARGHDHDNPHRPPVHCLCATMADKEDIDNGVVKEFLQDTGFSQFIVTAAVQTCFHWNRAPYLTVVGRTYPKQKSNGNSHNHNYSRKVISTTHEELALKWNTDQVSVERWLEGQSALSCQQQGMAMAIFPSCSIM